MFNDCSYIEKYLYLISIDDIIIFAKITRDDIIEFYPSIPKNYQVQSLSFGATSSFGQSIQRWPGRNTFKAKLGLRLNLLNQKWKHCRCIFNSPAAQTRKNRDEFPATNTADRHRKYTTRE